jgi:hypothetical protein
VQEKEIKKNASQATAIRTQTKQSSLEEKNMRAHATRTQFPNILLRTKEKDISNDFRRKTNIRGDKKTNENKTIDLQITFFSAQNKTHCLIIQLLDRLQSKENSHRKFRRTHTKTPSQETIRVTSCLPISQIFDIHFGRNPRKSLSQ